MIQQKQAATTCRRRRRRPASNEVLEEDREVVASLEQIGGPCLAVNFAAALKLPVFCNYVKNNQGISALSPYFIKPPRRYLGCGPDLNLRAFKAFAQREMDCIHETGEEESKNEKRQNNWEEKFGSARLLDIDGNEEALEEIRLLLDAIPEEKLQDCAKIKARVCAREEALQKNKTLPEADKDFRRSDDERTAIIFVRLAQQILRSRVVPSKILIANERDRSDGRTRLSRIVRKMVEEQQERAQQAPETAKELDVETQRSITDSLTTTTAGNREQFVIADSPTSTTAEPAASESSAKKEVARVEKVQGAGAENEEKDDRKLHDLALVGNIKGDDNTTQRSSGTPMTKAPARPLAFAVSIPKGAAPRREKKTQTKKTTALAKDGDSLNDESEDEDHAQHHDLDDAETEDVLFDFAKKNHEKASSAYTALNPSPYEAVPPRRLKLMSTGDVFNFFWLHHDFGDRVWYVTDLVDRGELHKRLDMCSEDLFQQPLGKALSRIQLGTSNTFESGVWVLGKNIHIVDDLMGKDGHGKMNPLTDGNGWANYACVALLEEKLRERPSTAVNLGASTKVQLIQCRIAAAKLTLQFEEDADEVARLHNADDGEDQHRDGGKKAPPSWDDGDYEDGDKNRSSSWHDKSGKKWSGDEDKDEDEMNSGDAKREKGQEDGRPNQNHDNEKDGSKWDNKATDASSQSWHKQAWSKPIKKNPWWEKKGNNKDWVNKGNDEHKWWGKDDNNKWSWDKKDKIQWLEKKKKNKEWWSGKSWDDNKASNSKSQRNTDEQDGYGKDWHSSESNTLVEKSGKMVHSHDWESQNSNKEAELWCSNKDKQDFHTSDGDEAERSGELHQPSSPSYSSSSGNKNWWSWGSKQESSSSSFSSNNKDSWRNWGGQDSSSSSSSSSKYNKHWWGWGKQEDCSLPSSSSHNDKNSWWQDACETMDEVEGKTGNAAEKQEEGTSVDDVEDKKASKHGESEDQNDYSSPKSDGAAASPAPPPSSSSKGNTKCDEYFSPSQHRNSFGDQQSQKCATSCERDRQSCEQGNNVASNGFHAPASTPSMSTMKGDDDALQRSGNKRSRSVEDMADCAEAKRQKTDAPPQNRDTTAEATTVIDGRSIAGQDANHAPEEDLSQNHGADKPDNDWNYYKNSWSDWDIDKDKSKQNWSYHKDGNSSKKGSWNMGEDDSSQQWDDQKCSWSDSDWKKGEEDEDKKDSYKMEDVEVYIPKSALKWKGAIVEDRWYPIEICDGKIWTDRPSGHKSKAFLNTELLPILEHGCCVEPASANETECDRFKRRERFFPILDVLRKEHLRVILEHIAGKCGDESTRIPFADAAKQLVPEDYRLPRAKTASTSTGNEQQKSAGDYEYGEYGNKDAAHLTRCSKCSKWRAVDALDHKLLEDVRNVTGKQPKIQCSNFVCDSLERTAAGETSTPSSCAGGERNAVLEQKFDMALVPTSSSSSSSSASNNDKQNVAVNLLELQQGTAQEETPLSCATECDYKSHFGGARLLRRTIRRGFDAKVKAETDKRLASCKSSLMLSIRKVGEEGDEDDAASNAGSACSLASVLPEEQHNVGRIEVRACGSSEVDANEAVVSENVNNDPAGKDHEDEKQQDKSTNKWSRSGWANNEQKEEEEEDDVPRGLSGIRAADLRKLETSEPHMFHLQADRLAGVVKKLTEKLDIEIPDSCRHPMVPDWTGTLKEGQAVTCRVTKNGEPEYLEGPALFVRTPCLERSDVQKMENVKPPAALRRFRNNGLIVLPADETAMQRAAAQALSGGDYDGDEALVIGWKHLVKLFVSSEPDYRNIFEMIRNQQWGMPKNADAESRRSETLADILTTSTRTAGACERLSDDDFERLRLASSKYLGLSGAKGQYTNEWYKYAAQLGLQDARTKVVAKLGHEAMDLAKNNRPASELANIFAWAKENASTVIDSDRKEREAGATSLSAAVMDTNAVEATTRSRTLAQEDPSAVAEDEAAMPTRDETIKDVFIEEAALQQSKTRTSTRKRAHPSLRRAAKKIDAVRQGKLNKVTLSRVPWRSDSGSITYLKTVAPLVYKRLQVERKAKSAAQRKQDQSRGRGEGAADARARGEAATKHQRKPKAKAVGRARGSGKKKSGALLVLEDASAFEDADALAEPAPELSAKRLKKAPAPGPESSAENPRGLREEPPAEEISAVAVAPLERDEGGQLVEAKVEENKQKARRREDFATDIKAEGTKVWFVGKRGGRAQGPELRACHALHALLQGLVAVAKSRAIFALAGSPLLSDHTRRPGGVFKLVPARGKGDQEQDQATTRTGHADGKRAAAEGGWFEVLGRPGLRMQNLNTLERAIAEAPRDVLRPRLRMILRKVSHLVAFEDYTDEGTYLLAYWRPLLDRVNRCATRRWLAYREQQAAYFKANRLRIREMGYASFCFVDPFADKRGEVFSREVLSLDAVAGVSQEVAGLRDKLQLLESLAHAVAFYLLMPYFLGALHFKPEATLDRRKRNRKAAGDGEQGEEPCRKRKVKDKEPAAWGQLGGSDSVLAVATEQVPSEPSTLLEQEARDDKHAPKVLAMSKGIKQDEEPKRRPTERLLPLEEAGDDSKAVMGKQQQEKPSRAHLLLVEDVEEMQMDSMEMGKASSEVVALEVETTVLSKEKKLGPLVDLRRRVDNEEHGYNLLRYAYATGCDVKTYTKWSTMTPDKWAHNAPWILFGNELHFVKNLKPLTNAVEADLWNADEENDAWHQAGEAFDDAVDENDGAAVDVVSEDDAEKVAAPKTSGAEHEAEKNGV
ncbi:unnamed protein product [Amoebophrya sp. A25]|nr:unnamed protein product [Amoebophrya sp. A25]|eukprot:GSA25T00004481001.1